MGKAASVHLAFAFTILFMLLHLYWAVGGTWGLAPAALDKKAEVQMVNWVVSAFMVIGAIYVLALNHPISRRVPSWILLPPIWTGAVVCLSHAIFGAVTKALYQMLSISRPCPVSAQLRQPKATASRRCATFWLSSRVS